MIEKSLVSIIILTFNGKETISDTLNSVLAQDYEDLEFIIVDNDSTDGTLNIAKDFRRDLVPFKGTKSLRIIENPKNVGLAGYNVGIEASKGDFVFCVNQDVILDKNYISEAVKCFNADKRIGAVQGKILRKEEQDSNKKIIDTTGHIIFKSRRIVDRGQGEEDKGQYDKIEEVFGVNGAAPMFRRKCLEDGGLLAFGSLTSEASEVRLPKKEYYDPDFFMYKEDVDLSWRIRLYGWKIIYCPGAIAYADRTSELINEKSGAIREVIKIRKKQSQFVKRLSFKNHRLLMIKNDLPWLLIKHLPWVLPREIAAWVYVAFFEPKTWPAIIELFKQMPNAWRKRKIIMKNKRVGSREMEKWFW